MYQALAEKTYRRLFDGDAVHVLSNNLEELQILITDTVSTLSSKAEKKLFYYELLELLQNDKIAKIKEQKRKYNSVLMSGYENIISLAYWLQEQVRSFEINKPKNLSPVYVKIWLSSDIALEHLAEELVANGFIDVEDKLNFLLAFNGNDEAKRVKWKSTQTLLLYLVNKLISLKKLNSNTSNSFIKSNFLSSAGKEIENSKQAKVNVKNTSIGKPRGYEKIDMITDTLK